MMFWRSLLAPLHPTSLFVVAFIASLHALVYSVEQVGPLRLLPALILLAWLFKYAYAFLEQASEGIGAAPIPSVEMLGPYELRPLLQGVVCGMVYLVDTWLAPVPAAILTCLSIAALPASIGALGISGSIVNAADPVVLWRMSRGLGSYYLLILLVSAAYVLGIVVLYRHSIWHIGLFAACDLAVLSVYAGIGGAIFERRIELGHEPRLSPERRQDQERRERIKLRNAMLDELYHPIQVGEFHRAIGPLNHWFEGAPAQLIEGDAAAIMSSAVQWNKPLALQAVTRCVVGALIRARKALPAMEALQTALARFPSLSLETEEQTVEAVLLVRSSGRVALARTLIRNFQAGGPDRQLGQAAQTLLRELDAR